MKKVAIVTTHRANNFGAQLQAYSLVESCKELGCRAEVLDWRCPRYEKMYHTCFQGGCSVRALWQNFWKLAVESPVRRKFSEFRCRIQQSCPIVGRDALEKVEAEYDTFITGSDQVWNPVNSAPGSSPETFDRAYLLDFVKEKSKNSYAASIGVSEIRPASLLPEFIEAWRSFDVISLREYEGAGYVKMLSGHDAVPVLDPVLLHDAKWWTAHCGGERGLAGRQAFVYNVNQIREFNEYARELSVKEKVALVRPIIPGQPSRHNVFGRVMGPEEFVTAIRDSEIVLSSSFHCAAFSLIYRKKVYIARRRTGNSPNSRYESLFRYAGVTPDVVKENGDVTILCVDFSRIDESIFEEQRQRSLEVLRKIVV